MHTHSMILRTVIQKHSEDPTTSSTNYIILSPVDKYINEMETVNRKNTTAEAIYVVFIKDRLDKNGFQLAWR